MEIYAEESAPPIQYLALVKARDANSCRCACVQIFAVCHEQFSLAVDVKRATVGQAVEETNFAVISLLRGVLN